MMATPQDLEDFAIGFSLTEGIIAVARRYRLARRRPLDDGIELRMWLAQSKAERLSERRRHIAGPTGCGLCGIDSIAEAVAARPRSWRNGRDSFTPQQIMAAMAASPPLQAINIADPRGACRGVLDTGSRHRRAARGCRPPQRARQARRRAGAAKVAAGEGMVLLTSRVSVEMVQKTAAIGAPLMVAVSAPTALAVRMADAAGITLVAIARADGFEIFTHPERIAPRSPSQGATAHVA